MTNTRLMFVQDWIYDKLNREEADLFDYERPLKVMPQQKKPLTFTAIFDGFLDLIRP